MCLLMSYIQTKLLILHADVTSQMQTQFVCMYVFNVTFMDLVGLIHAQIS